MSENSPHVSQSEYEVLKALWQLGGSAASTQLMEQLEPVQGWKLTTILTFLTRLAEKGIVVTQRGGRGRAGLYTALYTQAEMRAMETRQFLDAVHGGSVRSLMASLCAPGEISMGELDELRIWFQQEADKSHE